MSDLHLCIIGARLSEQTNGEIMAALGRVGLRVEQIEVCQPDELDALRKENEELRKDKARIDFLDDGNYGIDPRNIPGVTMNGKRFHCLAGRGDWSSLRDAIDAAAEDERREQLVESYVKSVNQRMPYEE